MGQHLEAVFPLSMETVVAIAMLSCCLVTSSLAVFLPSDPLHLTPLIRQGNITLAQNLSRVMDENGVLPESHAGFITVDSDVGNHVFFWFFPAIQPSPASTAPILLWLNGGPGVTSMFGLFFDNGPLRLRLNPNGYDRWPKSWAEKFSMLYVDSPVGVGFSYSDSQERGYRTTQQGYSKDLFEFASQFFELFPDYLPHQLYIGGTSYAGKYVTGFAYRLHQEIRSGRSKLPLTGIYLGSPFVDPASQILSYVDFFYSKGAATGKQVIEFKRETMKTLLSYRNGEMGKFSITEIMESIRPTFGSPDVGNYDSDEYPPFESIQEVMTSPGMRKAIHVGDVPYNATNMKVYDALKQDILLSAKSQLAKLMDNYKVLIYNGDSDGIVGAPVVEAALMSTPWSSQSEYNSSSRRVWRRGGRLLGFYTRVGRFCRVVVHGAGHSAGHAQPESTREMMDQFISHGCIQPHQEEQ